MDFQRLPLRFIPPYKLYSRIFQVYATNTSPCVKTSFIISENHDLGEVVVIVIRHVTPICNAHETAPVPCIYNSYAQTQRISLYFKNTISCLPSDPDYFCTLFLVTLESPEAYAFQITLRTLTLMIWRDVGPKTRFSYFKETRPDNFSIPYTENQEGDNTGGYLSINPTLIHEESHCFWSINKYNAHFRERSSWFLVPHQTPYFCRLLLLFR